MTNPAIDLLPEPTPLSKFIEEGVNDLDKTSHVFVRVMSNTSKVHKLCPSVRDFLNTYGIAGEFPYQSRLLMCFQEKDQGLIAFLAVYVQEYGSSCPPPNQNTINISIVDSVQLFEPPSHRRIVFQTVLLSYLEYMSREGFHAAFLWACPPQEGSEYIFYHRPQYQQTPTIKILQDWYKLLMQIGVDVGVLKKFDNLFEWCKINETAANFFRHLPYFFEDHWPLEIQNAVSCYENSDFNRIDKRGKKSKGKRIQKSSSIIRDKDEYIFKTILTALKKNQHSFYCMTLNCHNSSQSSKMVDSELRFHFADNRDTVVKYFTDNNLEFADIRSAKLSTIAFLKKIRSEYQYVYCDICCSTITNNGLMLKMTERTFLHERVVEGKSEEEMKFPFKTKTAHSPIMPSNLESINLNLSLHCFSKNLHGMNARIFDQECSCERRQERVVFLPH